jgi:DNA modification methylase
MKFRQRPSSASAAGFLPAASGTFVANAIERLPIDQIKAYERNARTHNDRQIKKLAGVIKTVGFLVPIIVDDTDIIVAGHGRWAAAKELGLKEVPAIRAGHLTKEQVQAFRLADNKLGELSTWDDATLAIEMRALAAVQFDLEILDLTAFETAEIDLIIEPVSGGTSKPDQADIVPEADPVNVVSELGDLWILGAHRLYCGSALERQSYEMLLGATRVRSVWSDPPYNVRISGHVSGLGKVHHREFAMASGEMSEDQFTAFLEAYLELAKEFSEPGSLHYVCMDGAHAWELLTAARRATLALKATCTWAKTNAGMGSFYRQQTEFVHVFKNGDDSVHHVNNVQLGKYGRYRTTLWTYAGVNTFRKGRTADLAAHPTVKPWVMVADAIKDCTSVGDGVLDCFCGSGTTLIAAEKSRRIGYGIELDPAYVDVAIRRWQAVAGKEAIHAETQQSFSDVAKLRRSSGGMANDCSKEAQHA